MSKNFNKLNILALIPARMGSSRFPGKPMAKILGKPMIGHVYEKVSSSNLLNKVVVATCDNEILDYINKTGGEAVMTSNKHERASDRCAEALIILEKKYRTQYDIIVMVQGDEPLVNSSMINEALKPMIDDQSIKVVNLLGEINDEDEFNDQNCIKVVCDLNMNAMYFSRQPIPTNNSSFDVQIGKQVCIIPFRREYLIEYTNLEPTPLEIAESIDMLRVIENGDKVKMVETKHFNQSVDTQEDLKKVSALINNQKLKL